MNLTRPETRLPETLSVPQKIVYAFGDFTINTALAALSLIHATYFLIEVAGLRPVLAGLVPLIARTVDAVTDPLMGRISDQTRWRAGRRRPYFLIGAAPFGIAFALMWMTPSFASDTARFAYYTAVYCALSIAMTVLSIPYLALLPEMALGYDERTALNTYRNVGSTLGVFAAVAMRPLADLFGGGAEGFARAGTAMGVVLTVPWIAVWAATFERPGFRERRGTVGFVEELRQLARHDAFQRLIGFYLCGRIAMDLGASMLILYFTYWIGRSGDFEPSMIVFMGTVVAVLPLWLHAARRRDKVSIFTVGAMWWIVSLGLLFLVQPDWPRASVFVLLPLTAVGFAAVDLMPWSMIGDVIDEDDLASGERREGLYNGVFTFLRKLGGAVGVFLILAALDLAGLRQGTEQTPATREAVRWVTVFGPAIFLVLALWQARGYPLTREVHARILTALAARHRAEPHAGSHPAHGVTQAASRENLE